LDNNPYNIAPLIPVDAEIQIRLFYVVIDVVIESAFGNGILGIDSVIIAVKEIVCLNDGAEPPVGQYLKNHSACQINQFSQCKRSGVFGSMDAE
jgi:hypothetical protein